MLKRITYTLREEGKALETFEDDSNNAFEIDMNRAFINKYGCIDLSVLIEGRWYSIAMLFFSEDSDESCIACGGDGILQVTVYDDGAENDKLEIQRCDTCQRFKTDEEAQAAYIKGGA
jgi:hypothetical protein